MIKSTIFYGLTTGINKATALIYLPVLVEFLTVAEYGLFSLSQVIASLLAPVLSLNAGVSILREGTEDQGMIGALSKKYLTYIFPLNALLLVLFYWSDFSTNSWLFWAISIAVGEGLLLLIMNILRAQDNYIQYFLVVAFKSLAIFLIILYVQYKGEGLALILKLQAIVTVLIFMFFFLLFWLRKAALGSLDNSFKTILYFGLAFIPHGISQWVLSGSDKLLIKEILNEEMLGYYSLAYTIGMVLMLVNSGVAMALPTFMIKDFKSWISGTNLLKYTKLYGIATIGVLFFVFLGLWIDMNYLHKLKHYNEEVFFNIVIIFAGIYYLGLYYFFANYLFYHKKSALISKTTLTCAVINVLLTTSLLYILGIYGAAIATLLSYIIYVLLMKRAAINLEPEIKGKSNKVMFESIVVLVIILSGGYFAVENILL